MNCRDVAQLAGAYLESNAAMPGVAQLAPLEHHQLTAHLATCAACRDHLRRLRSLDETDLPLAVQLELQDRLDPARLHDLAQARRAPKKPERRSPPPVRTSLRPLLVAMAAVLAGWLGYRLATQEPATVVDAALHPASSEHFRPAGWSPPNPDGPR